MVISRYHLRIRHSTQPLFDIYRCRNTRHSKTYSPQMQPIHESRVRDHQMPVSSPKCILNCQALSIHLPPLPEPRDHSSKNKHISSPMSASPKHSRFVSPPQTHLSYHRQYSDSPTSTRSASNQPISAQGRGIHDVKSRPQDLNCRAGTPKSGTDVNSRSSVQLTNDVQYLRDDSIDERSSVNQVSPEAQQLAAGPPGIARRAKAHVPSACVNCKRKHLACETKRPCTRCVQTGKEVSKSEIANLKAQTLTFDSRPVLMFNTRNGGDRDFERKKAHVMLISDVNIPMGKIIRLRTVYSRFLKSNVGGQNPTAN